MASPLDPFRLPLRLVDDLSRIAEAVAELPRVVALLADVREDVRVMRAELDGLTVSLESMDGKFDVMQRGIDPLDDDMASVERAVLALPPRMDAMTAHLDGLRSDLAGLPFVSRSDG